MGQVLAAWPGASLAAAAAEAPAAPLVCTHSSPLRSASLCGPAWRMWPPREGCWRAWGCAQRTVAQSKMQLAPDTSYFHSYYAQKPQEEVGLVCTPKPVSDCCLLSVFRSMLRPPAVGVQMLAYGCTRLEVGLQSTYEDVARDTNRGHTVASVGGCFQLAKDAGFKVRRLLGLGPVKSWRTACAAWPAFAGLPWLNGPCRVRCGRHEHGG